MAQQTLDFEMKLLGDRNEVKVNEHGQEIGIVTGLASTWGNIDRVNDVVIKGAFADAKVGLPFLWQHKQDMPIGKITSLKETSSGLEFEAELVLAVPKAREAHELMKAGVITTTSIGYRVKSGGFDFVKMVDPTTKKERRVRRLKNIDLGEISAVTTPANTRAEISGVKSEDGSKPSKRDLEMLLMDYAGLSANEAKSLISKGYDGAFSTKNDDELDESQVLASDDDESDSERDAGSVSDLKNDDSDAERDAGSTKVSDAENTPEILNVDKDVQAKADAEAIADQEAQSVVAGLLGKFASSIDEMKKS